MDLFVIATIVVVLAASFGYINVRFFKLPNTIGLMLITILFTLAVFGIGYFNDALLNAEKYVLSQIDFRSLLLDVLLSFMLFAGALHTDFEQLKAQRWPVIVFATLGVLSATFLIGALFYFTLFPARPENTLPLLPVVWRPYLSYRSHCRTGNPEKSRGTQEAGNQDRGGIPI